MLVQMMRAQPPSVDISVEDTRAGFEVLGALMPPEPEVSRETVDVDGVSAEWITAPNASDAATLLYLHGGGYVIGSTNVYAGFVGRLSAETGLRALALNYRLAPEDPFPAALDDATTAYRWLLKHAVRPEAIIIAGDSAGGGLTAATLLALKAAGDPLPLAAVMISPWTDLSCSGDTHNTHAHRDPALTPEILQHWAKFYTGANSATDPLISPLFGDYSGLPPMLVMVGDSEVLLDDSRQYAEKAKAAGVDVTLEVWDEMVHIFPVFAPMLPEGQKGIERIGEWVREHVKTGATA
jgi:epsilon-lactone hydrolase